MKMRSFIKIPAIVLAFVCISLASQAQPGGGGPDPDPPVNGVPLDGGFGILVAAGIAYAAKRKHDSRMKAKIVDNKEN
jgi:hypothetical protein